MMAAAASSAAVCDSVALSFVLQMEILCGRRGKRQPSLRYVDFGTRKIRQNSALVKSTPLKLWSLGNPRICLNHYCLNLKTKLFH